MHTADLPRFDAWHLPGVPAAGFEVRERLVGRGAGNDESKDESNDEGNGNRKREGALLLRQPVVTPELVGAAMASLRAAATGLHRRPVASIVEALAVVGERFAPSGADRAVAEQVLTAATGYSRPMIALALDWVSRLLSGPALTGLLTRELGDPQLLDGLRPRSGAAGLSRAYGPGLTALIFSGNVPGVPALSLASALLVKSPCLAKAASGEPVFPALFAQALAKVDAELGRAVVALGWRGGDNSIEAALLQGADALVVYGGDSTLDSLRRRTPASTTFIGYGHKLSFAVVGREAQAADRINVTARRAARDVSMFDQQACLSPHLIYVEGDRDAALAFAQALAVELARFEAEVPRGRLSAGEAAAIQRLRGIYELRSIVEPGVAMQASAGSTAWTVLTDPDPRFEASCLNRTVRVKPMPDLADLPVHVQGIRHWLQSVGVALPAERLAPLAETQGAWGATRLCPFGSMAEPSAEWHHDGRANLLDLVRWLDCEV
jgi:hypothetical protein